MNKRCKNIKRVCSLATANIFTIYDDNNNRVYVYPSSTSDGYIVRIITPIYAEVGWRENPSCCEFQWDGISTNPITIVKNPELKKEWEKFFTDIKEGLKIVVDDPEIYSDDDED